MVVANHARLGGRERLRGTAAIDTIERRITQPPTFISYPLRVGTVKTGPLTFIFATWHDLVIYHRISLRSRSVEEKVFRRSKCRRRRRINGEIKPNLQRVQVMQYS